jgi:hypothetical protein
MAGNQSPNSMVQIKAADAAAAKPTGAEKPQPSTVATARAAPSENSVAQPAAGKAKKAKAAETASSKPADQQKVSCLRALCDQIRRTEDCEWHLNSIALLSI